MPAVHIARDGIGLADRAIETRESGAIRRNRIRPGPWRLHRRAWFGLSPVRGNRLDRRFCSANVIMEPRWRPAKQRCPDPATAPSVAPSIPESLFGKGTGPFLQAGRRPGGTETARAATVSRSCQRFARTGNRGLEFSPRGEITRHAEDAGRGFVPRRVAAAVASLNRWRGMLRRAKRRRSSGNVSKSASMKISTVSSLAQISTRTGASPKSTSCRRPFAPRIMAWGILVSLSDL